MIILRQKEFAGTYTMDELNKNYENTIFKDSYKPKFFYETEEDLKRIKQEEKERIREFEERFEGKKKNSTKQKEDVTEGLVKKGLNKWKNLSKGKKVAAIAVPTVAAAGIGVAVHKSKKKKSEEDSK